MEVARLFVRYDFFFFQIEKSDDLHSFGLGSKIGKGKGKGSEN